MKETINYNEFCDSCKDFEDRQYSGDVVLDFQVICTHEQPQPECCSSYQQSINTTFLYIAPKCDKHPIPLCETVDNKDL